MDNTLYTPGDWFVEWTNSTLCEIKSKDDLSKPITTLSAYYYDKMVVDFEELENNAKIIAESKNLLQIAEMFRDSMRGTNAQNSIVYKAVEEVLRRINNK